MAKKNLASLINGIMGDNRPQKSEAQAMEQPEITTAEVTDEMKANL